MNRIQRDLEQISFQEVLFYGYFVTMMLIKGLGYADGPIYKAGLIVAFLFAVGKIFLTAYTKVEWLVVVALLGLAGINRVRTGLDSAWMVVALVLSMKNISVRRTMQIGAVVWPSLFVFQVVTHLTGLRSFDFVIHNKFGLGYVIRWAMGYVHPNVLQISYNVAVFYLVYSFCRKKESLKKAFWISLIGGIYIFLYSFSITGMLMFAAFWMFVFGLLLCRKQHVLTGRAGQALIMAVLPAEAAASILLPLILKGKAFDFLEKLMTHRPSLTKYFFTTYGISLLGQNPKGLISNYTLDCSYANLLFHGGIILFILLMVGYWMLICREMRNYTESENLETIVELAITLACLTGAVSEPFAFNTSFKNISLIFLGHAVYSLGEKQTVYGFPGLGKRYSECFFRKIVAAKCVCRRFLRRIRRWHSAFQQNGMKLRRMILLVGILTGLLGAFVYWNNAERVQEYYSCRVNTDAGEEQKESIYLTREQVQNLQKDPSVRVLSYRDDKTQMVSFDGRIGQIEFIRGFLSAGLWGFLIGAGGVLAAGSVWRERQRSRTGNQ